jgi:tetratricopeptide (TPR) repeat protein
VTAGSTVARKTKTYSYWRALDYRSTLTSVNDLARTLEKQDQYEEAEATLRQTLATREKVLGKEHPSTLTTMNNLATVLDRRGKYEEAESMLRQTLASHTLATPAGTSSPPLLACPA